MSEPRDVSRDDLLAALRIKKERIASALRTFHLDDDLDPSARDRLAGIVRRYQTAFQQFRASRSLARALGTDARRGDSQRRMLFRKIDAAIAAVEDALTYATDDAKTQILKRKLQAVAVPRLVSAKGKLAEIAEWKELIAPTGPLRLQDPRRDATQAFVSFFRNECGFPQSEAQARTAEIFTRFQWRQASAERGQADVAASGSSTENRGRDWLSHWLSARRRRHARS